MAQCARNNCLPGRNDGDDFIQTRLDDSAHRDLYSIGFRRAPFTGKWRPALNSKHFLFGRDPIGQLGRYHGTRSAGSWKVHIVDDTTPDSGTLQAWSLIVTPVAYSCGP